MVADDQRQYRDFYGIYTDDWTISFGTFSDDHHILNESYISEGCSTTESSEASITHNFIYPHYIKKVLHIEGIMEGNICLAASGCTSTVTEFRVTLCKTYEGMAEPDEEIFSTGWITVNDTLAWDSGLSIGEEMVYHYWITCVPEHRLTGDERMYLKIEVNCDSCTHLMHANDPDWKDVWASVPLRM